ncbi:HAD-like domain-containing protein [Chytriomyces sp. MP71]|nr:HAD-like domain-containing protein [Chytriomyces sp. MP71]
MYHLLAVDLDGTLLNKAHGVVSQRTINAIHAVLATGAHVAICTGRPHLMTTSIEDQLGVPVHCICYNGAVVLSPAPVLTSPHQRTILFKQTLTRSQVTLLSAAAEDLNLVATHHAHGHVAVRVRMEGEAQCAQWEEFNSVRELPLELVSDFECVELPVKMLLLAQDPQRAADRIRSKIEGVTVYPEDTFLDCIPSTVDKSVGVRKLCEALGIAMEQSVCFGDGVNDVEFLKAAGLGFAMANALEEVKAVANRVTRPPSLANTNSISSYFAKAVKSKAPPVSLGKATASSGTVPEAIDSNSNKHTPLAATPRLHSSLDDDDDAI